MESQKRSEDFLDVALGVIAMMLLERGYKVNAENLYNNIDDVSMEQCEEWLLKGGNNDEM